MITASPGTSRKDRGSATVETALALPALMTVVAIALWGIAAAAANLTCIDAAHTGARAAARGEPPEAVRTAILRAAPPHTTVTLTTTPDTTHLTVTTVFHPPLHLPLPALTFQATAEAPTEPTP
ncbi:TadE family type IV pilus minor pilin [Actinocorallia longicatena]|uniref:TadE-like domain-containing protein n=1 Tax=Actinocorallia longicatena TaxID=111803 RepID=A0ABP6QFW9_9ACTN